MLTMHRVVSIKCLRGIFFPFIFTAPKNDAGLCLRKGNKIKYANHKTLRT